MCDDDVGLRKEDKYFHWVVMLSKKCYAEDVMPAYKLFSAYKKWLLNSLSNPNVSKLLSLAGKTSC